MKPAKLLSDGERKALLGAVVLGALAFAAGLVRGPARAWADLLIGNLYFVSLSLAAACFIAIQYLASARWSVVLRRVPEAMTAYLPAGAAVAAVLLAGAARLYPWARAGEAAADPLILGKAAYLNLPAFASRTALFFAAWLFFTRRMVSVSREQDRTGGLEPTFGNRRLSAVFLVVFGLTFTAATVDWTMSLEPRWFSTIYPWYVFSGAFVNAVAVMALLAVELRRRGVLSDLHDAHLHDLGRLVFAFSVFWAYLWYSQYLLIWYSNLPEETTFYLRRLAPGWRGLFWLNPIVNFAAPFFLLLTIKAKRSPRVLLRAGVLLVLGHWLNLYLLVMPAVDPAGARPGLLELLTFAGFAAAFLLSFDASFRSAAPVPLADPLLEEGRAFHGA